MSIKQNRCIGIAKIAGVIERLRVFNDNRCLNALEWFDKSSALTHSVRENLRLIEERKAEYVMGVDVPIQLVKEEWKLKECIASWSRG